ncbi:TMEM138 [Lepeophtheirus salmonis]|uniref:Transmembrane protein 138 n=1 Tax=Lepeophtheirus salmonis TaxID=72036 RepID=A0A0K2UPC7_LEPSM|nr:transmembrane protein 138-like [Lepeophtheirus salmonis]CAB4056802.1 TMEM138 [Lepeophtheirus salmonis]CAF2805606.1 TMEM138 [Lepeophtheirus salmonis]
MKLSIGRYRSVLMTQYAFLITDLLINTFCEYLRFESVILLVIFVIQDVCLIFSLIIVFLSFFSTYVFQAGLVGVLFNEFKTPIFVTITYICLSIGFHIWSLNVRWYDPVSFWWTDGLVALYVFQRSMSTLYYYYYKRTALQITNPKFYDDSSWIQGEWGR